MNPYAANATGWNELLDGKIVQAVYNAYNIPLGSIGIPVLVLFFVYQIMLYAKTRNVALTWLTGVLFVSMYGLSIYVESLSLQLMFFLLVIELAGILYMALFNK